MYYYFIILILQDNTSPGLNGNVSPREKLNHKDSIKKEDRMSPRSDASSHGSSSSLKPKPEVRKILGEKNNDCSNHHSQ